jgi:hypothetical protein
MAKAIVIGVVVVAVAAGAIWWACGHGSLTTLPRPDRHRPRTDEEGRVVLMAFGRDWAKRFGSTEGELSAALIAGADAALADRVGREVGSIELRFDDPSKGRDVPVTLIVSYTSSRERSTACVSLGWDDVPHGVRADLLRGTGTPVFRTWRADG